MKRIYKNDKYGSPTLAFREQTSRLHDLLEALNDEVASLGDAGWHPRDLELHLLNYIHQMFVGVRVSEILERERALGVLTSSGWKDNPRCYEAPDGFVTTDLSAAIKHASAMDSVKSNSSCIFT